MDSVTCFYAFAILHANGTLYFTRLRKLNNHQWPLRVEIDLLDNCIAPTNFCIVKKRSELWLKGDGK